MSETRGWPAVTIPLQIQLNSTSLPVTYKYEFGFERWYDHEWGVGLFQQYWATVGVPAVIIYVILIFAGQKYMETRAPFNLRGALTLWSFGLAVFSWCGCIRAWEETYYTYTTQGLQALSCDAVAFKGASGLWAWLFTASKLIELGDTAFIILRKQKLIFLHWYHHITVLLYTFYSFSNYTATGRYFVLMNFTVHAIMYTYYALKASRLINIPRRVNIVITCMQITQMFVGIVVNLDAHLVLKRGELCNVTQRNLEVSFVMYLSYFVLFAQYFYQAYAVKQLGGKPKDTDKHHMNGKLDDKKKR